MLTTKKRNFAEAWMRGENKTQSAIQAGYSAASAKYKGHELSKDKDVLAYIERMKGQTPAAPPEAETEPVKAVVKQRNIEATPAPELVTAGGFDDPLVVMRRIMNDNLYSDPKLSLDAAAKLAPYVSSKMGESGKKEQKNTAAKKAANSFTSMSPPKLVVNNAANG